MRQDIREDVLFREAANLFARIRRPGASEISDAAELHVSADGKRAVFTGSLATESGPLVTRIFEVDLATGAVRQLSNGPNSDRSPKFAPDGRQIAFLSDRTNGGDFQLQIMDAQTGEILAAPQVDGWVEYIQWAPTGARILLGVAGHGADVAGGNGAIASKHLGTDRGDWMPTVVSGKEEYGRRHAWICDVASARTSQVSTPEWNIWDACWCGDGALVAVVSQDCSEAAWYRAHLRLVEVRTGESREIYSPQDQLGKIAASPDGRWVSVVESICSDRSIVAGALLLIDAISMLRRHLAVEDADISYVEWQSNRHLLLAGHRGAQTIVGSYDQAVSRYHEIWSSTEVTTGGFYASVAGLREVGDCALIGESFVRAPELATIRAGSYSVVRSFDLEGIRKNLVQKVASHHWVAPDGVEIQGWLLLPAGSGPFPTIMNVHGGPVWHWRPTWLGRRGLHTLMLLARGYAVFYPNPRGSSGRGQDFIRHVVGDPGGADTWDYLSGIDSLIEQGLADPRRIGVTGVSYGGYMASWLITQNSRFAAAVSISPITNYVSAHLVSNISNFVSLFLRDKFNNPNGLYFTRSPIMHVDKAKTPTLNICGALDRCTPPEEAVQFHNALLEVGCKSTLAIYPKEGHGIRQFPAVFDYSARVTGWFEEHLG